MLDKKTIMLFLKEYSDLQREYVLLGARENYLVNTIKKIDDGPTDIGYKNLDESIAFGVIVSSLLLGLMGTPFAAIIIAILGHATVGQPAEFLYKAFHWTFAYAHPIWTHILFSFFVVTILAIPLAILAGKDERAGSVERFNSYQRALSQRPEFVNELSDISKKKQVILSQLKQLSAQGILHSDYLPYTDQILWYFEKGRADTLKEAINLLEHDLEEKDRREDEKEYREMMRQKARQQQESLEYIAGETSRAADAAQSAAAWSAAGAILTASEIERQKKRERN